MNRRIIHFLLIFIMPSLIAQSESLTEYQVKAAYLYNFVKFVNWPENTFKDNHEAITIALYKYDPVEEELRHIIQGRTIDSRSIRIMLFEIPQDITGCHVLYLGNIERRHQISIINMLGHQPVLTISDADYFCRTGGMIQFVIKDNRLKLKINRKAVESAKLEISAKLLRVSQLID